MVKQERLPFKKTAVEKKAIEFIEKRREASTAKDAFGLAEEQLLAEMHKAKVSRLLVDGIALAVKFTPGKERIKVE